MEKGTLGGCSKREESVVDVQLVVLALHIVVISKKRMTRQGWSILFFFCRSSNP